MSDAALQIQQALADLKALSFVAHRDVSAVLPTIGGYGDAQAAVWLQAAIALFQHDRDAGKAFIRGSAAVAQSAGGVEPWTAQARAFTQWRGSWKAVEGFMRNLPEAYARLAPAGEARWAELGLRWCARHLESGVAYFRADVAALVGDGGVGALEDLLAPAEALCAERRLALATYLDGALRVRDLLGAEAVAPWARRGADVLQAGRLRGEAFFRLESDESLTLLLENVPGFRMPEHERFLSLLLRAWFGEELALRDSRWSPDRGRAFIETDGRALFLPFALPDREEALLALLHTAAHLAFDSYERRHVEALFRAAGAEHPPLDPDRRITWRPLFARFGDDLLRFQLIFDACEDLRVDWRLNALVPNHLRRLRAAARARPRPSGPARDYYEFALSTVEGALAGTLDARLRPLLAAEATVVDAFRIAGELYQDTPLPRLDALALRDACFLPGRSPNAARPVYPRARLDAAQFGTGTFDRDDASRNAEIKPNPEQRETPRGGTGDDSDFNIPPEDTSGSGGRVGVGIPQPAYVYGHARGPGLSERGTPYHEWDYRERRYKRQWAWVQERVLDESDADAAARLRATHAATLARLKRAIQSQKPARPAPLKRRLEGDELDLEATVAYVSEKRAGRAPRPAVYRERAVRARDTAVLLLADLSTSIMQSAQGGGRVVDRLRAGLLLFAESLEEAGDAYAIAGFASKHRDHVSYYPIKEFNERLTPGARAAIGGLSGRLATRMGAAMRHALTRFDRVASARRLLLVLSDGRPADYDDGGDERYLHEDTRMAVKEAAERGVHAFCVTVDPSGSEYLPRIFGPGHYTVIDRVEQLPARLPEIYLKLKRSA